MTLRIPAIVLLATTALHAGSSPLATAPTEFARAQSASAIHWQPWTDEVLELARKQDKSVYVFIGSPLSELTRATINQTFTSEKTVAWINENFYCIFVDADAQPGLAAYGQHFISTVKQLRGSPVHLWLTPDTLQPYDGANYLPPSEEWGKPGFLKAARSALDTWTVEPARARALADEALGMMKSLSLDSSATIDLKARLDLAAEAWIAAIDPKHGGFGSAPKLPEPELIRFLLGRDKAAQAAAINAARALVAGAAHDPVDGGFYRRCIDEEWKEPYYQKTLVDQARIALALFDAADVAKDAKLRAAGIGALDFVLKELKNPDGSFAAALDGTLEENADPAKRPKFVRVGQARRSATSLFILAVRRSGEERLFREVTKSELPETEESKHPALERFREVVSQHGTAADWLATALSFRYAKQDTAARVVMNRVNELYFDSATGTYQATIEPLPPGIAVRVPALGDTPSAEVLALLAGVDQKTADLIRVLAPAVDHQIQRQRRGNGDHRIDEVIK